MPPTMSSSWPAALDARSERRALLTLFPACRFPRSRERCSCFEVPLYPRGGRTVLERSSSRPRGSSTVDPAITAAIESAGVRGTSVSPFARRCRWPRFRKRSRKALRKSGYRPVRCGRTPMARKPGSRRFGLATRCNWRIGLDESAAAIRQADERNRKEGFFPSISLDIQRSTRGPINSTATRRSGQKRSMSRPYARVFTWDERPTKSTSSGPVSRTMGSFPTTLTRPWYGRTGRCDSVASGAGPASGASRAGASAPQLLRARLRASGLANWRRRGCVRCVNQRGERSSGDPGRSGPSRPDARGSTRQVSTGES